VLGQKVDFTVLSMSSSSC